MPFRILNRRRERPEDHPTVAFVDELLRQAVRRGATDIHVEPRPGGGGRVRLRIDGFFTELDAIDAELFPRVVARLKVMAGLAVFRTGTPQDGRIETQGEAGGADLRLSTLPVLGGEKAVVRLFDRAGAPRRLGDLGLTAGVEEAVRSLLDLPAGVLLVLGPCSSGKTTSLYALARELVAIRGGWSSLVSVEDPVEQRVEGMSQTEVDPGQDLTFPRVLAALLRQDPEGIVVGEIRDAETARMAVEAGFTGHRVLSTMHVGEPAEAVRRLELMGVPGYLIADALRGAVAQRLLRRSCTRCGGAGCGDCGETGYRGRFAVAEVARYEAGGVVPATSSIGEDARGRADAGDTTAEEIVRVLGAVS